jgi:hypothetical protein
MPYADPEKRKAYQREYSRRRRAGLPKGHPQTLFTVTVQTITAEDILGLLGETIEEVRAADADVLVRARVIGYLAGVTIRTLEVTGLEARLEAVEEALNLRRAI